LQEGQYESSVPNTADRVVQASLKAVLEPIFEADFKGCVFLRGRLFGVVSVMRRG